MSTQITTAFVKQFTNGITMLAQQKNSRLRGLVKTESGITGDRAFFDQIGSVTATPYTTRHGDTPLTDTPHSRRMVTMTPYKHADLIDRADKIRTLNDPQNDYVRAFGAAFGRAIDQKIIDKALASASTGVDGSSSTSFDTTNYQIAHNSEGMTLAKINEAKQILDAAENDDMGGYSLAVQSKQVENVMNDSTITSADYNTMRLLSRGEINTFGGFNWTRLELLSLSSTTRSCLAWARDSLLLAIGENPNGRISERADKNYSVQVFYSMDIGSTRMDETGVVEVQCTES